MAEAAFQEISHALKCMGKIYEQVKITEDVIELRADINSEEEAEEFIKTYGYNTKVDFRTSYAISNPKRVVMSKCWVCKHTSLHKRESSCRNAQCKAQCKILIKKVNRFTERNDPYLKKCPPLTAKMEVKFQHSHLTNSADYLRLRRVSEKTKEEFEAYFLSGMSAAEARNLHESKLLLQENAYELLADASINPTPRQVNYLHDIWRKSNFGQLFNPVDKLLEKIPLYEKEGCGVHVNEGCILIVTAIQKRNQALPSSGEIIFVDSTSRCDTMQSTVTVMLGATNAGAIPICILIHDAQTQETYIKAFQLLKTHYPKCFGGNEAPAVFITDDSTAEKGALCKVWPTAKQLLCQFHVAQAEWRWLCSSQSSISTADRQHCMKLFQKVMYSKNEEELEQAVSSISKLEKQYPAFVQRFNAFYERRDEWLTLCRNDLITRRHHTNNYAEVTIRILKDIILCRTKAFNVVALVDFCVTVWEQYFIKRIMFHANNRDQRSAVAFRKLSSKMKSCNVDEVVQIEEHIYLVPSESKKEKYMVNTLIGTCTCPFGSQGAFCKHMAFLVEKKGVHVTTSPPVTYMERFKLGQLALGEKCPDVTYFYDYKDIGNTHATSTSGNNCSAVNTNTVSETMELSELQQTDMAVQPLEDTSSTSMSMIMEDIQQELNRIATFVNTSNEMGLKKLLWAFRKIRNANQMNSLCHDIYKSSLSSTRKGGYIKVQPTAIQRRRCNVTKGAKRIPSGRPPSGVPQRRQKRKHNLGQNISQNQPNAKIHGKGH